MPIEVQCPNGHQLWVKDELAGKTGLCPRCRAKVQVPVRKPVPEDEQFPFDFDEFVRQEPQHEHTGGESGVIPSDSSCFLKKHKSCPGCGNLTSYSFSHCPRCGMPLSACLVESRR